MKYILTLLLVVFGASAQDSGFSYDSVASESSSRSGSTSPASPVNSVQYNDAGSFGGSSGMTYTSSTGLLAVSTGISSSIISATQLGLYGTTNLLRGAFQSIGGVSVGYKPVVAGGTFQFQDLNSVNVFHLGLSSTANQRFVSTTAPLYMIGSAATIATSATLTVASYTTLNSATTPVRPLTVASLVTGAGTNALCYDTATGAVTYGTCTISDISLKKNIQDYSGGLSKVLKLRPATYTFTEKKYGKGTQIGLIAQEVEKVFPSFVQTENTNAVTLKSVDYAKMVVPLISAVQELTARIEVLEEKQSLMK